MYEVLHWGSNPEEGNDDCHQGWEFSTLEEAMEKFQAEAGYRVAYVELVGPNKHFIRKNEAFDPRRCAADAQREQMEWRREVAMQAGMGLGCEAYNDEMGWGS
jgi:hypothetical protein